MGFIDMLKRGGSGVAKGVGAVVRAAVKPVEEQPAPAEGTSPAPADKIPAGFTLPDLDENDPDFADRKAVHDAILALDKQWTESMPEIDYRGHYRRISEDMKKGPKEREWNVLSKLAVALGTQDPDNPYGDNPGLRQMKEASTSRLSEERKEFEEIMGLKKEAISGQIRQLLEQGKFRQALTELHAREQLGITKGRREHEFKLAEEEAKGQTRKEVARIQAQGALERAERRLTYLKEQSGKLRLSPSDKALMDNEYRASAARLAEIKKQWQEGMLSDEQVEEAEEEHRQEMRRIHDYYEDREIGERPPDAGPRGQTTRKPAASGGGLEPNPEDPWFKR